MSLMKFNSELEFKKVSLEMKPTIDRYFFEFGESSCQHSFVSSYCLCNKYDDHYFEKDDVLYINRNGLSTDEYKVYLFPMCDRNDNNKLKEAINNIICDAHSENKKVKFFTTTKKCKEIVENLFGNTFIIEDVRDLYEYMYDIEKISTLSGSLYQSKRNIINKLCKTFGDRLSIRELCKTDNVILSDFYRKWYDVHYKALKSLIENEVKEFNLIIDNYDRLNLYGIGIFLDDEMIGFNIGARVNSETYDGMIQKGNVEYDGIYELLNRETAKRWINDFKYMNFEEDLGLAGLRNAKEMYHPEFMIEKFILTEA